MINQVELTQRAVNRGLWWRVWGWSGLLLVVQGLLRGFYYETNDDILMDLLMRGVSAAEPVRNLHMFLHGWSQLMAGLYTVAPGVPWYALLLYTMLYLALAASFWTIEMVVANRIHGWMLLVVETGFYCLTYFLHALLINFTRPSLLLGAAAGLILLVPRPSMQPPSRIAWLLAALALLAAWGFRPSGAALGLVLTLPLVIWQGWRRGTRIVAMLGGLLLLLTVGHTVTASTTTKAYESSNKQRVNIFDYSVAQLEVSNPVDSLAYLTMMPYQGLNDSVLLNPGFFARVMHMRTGQRFNLRVYQEPLRLAVGSTVLRLPGCLLLVAFGAGLVMAALRRGQLQLRSWPVLVYIAYQGLFWGVFLVLVPHFPLRVLQPIMTIYLLVNVIMVDRYLLPTSQLTDLPIWMRRSFSLAGVSVVALWLVVNGRLLSQLIHENAAQTAYLAHLETLNGPGVVIEQNMPSLYGHLSPLDEHHFTGYRKIFMLAGWTAFDPSQILLRQSLTGTRDLPASLLRLNKQAGTNWVMQPSFARIMGRYLNERLALPPGQRVHFELIPDSYPTTTLIRPPYRFRLCTETDTPR
jgi:hypothetical protein